MSIAAVNWARAQKMRPASRKLVLFVLASRADADAICFPGQELIAEDCCLSVREVQRHLDALEEGGFIERERRLRDGFRTSDRYFLHLERGESGETVEAPSDAQLRRHLRRVTAMSRDTGDRSKATPVSGLLKESTKGKSVCDLRAREDDTQSQRLESDPQSSVQPETENAPRALTLVGDPQPKLSAVPDEYPPDFERLWAAYPQRRGENSKKAAFKAYMATLGRDAKPADVLRAVKNYVSECKANGTVGTQFVRMAATFLGRAEHWREWVGGPITTEASGSDLPNTTWPEGFNLDDEMRGWAQERGVSADAEFVKFKHHAIDKAIKHRDWRGAFREWLDNAKRFAEERQLAKDMMEKMANFQLKSA
jgi:DNA-binding MarR family transcriptional regulator